MQASTQKYKPFPELRALMAKYGVSQVELGESIGNTYHTFGKKLNFDKSEFSHSDMIKIRDYFRQKGEDVTVEYIFFDWLRHYSEGA